MPIISVVLGQVLEVRNDGTSRNASPYVDSVGDLVNVVAKSCSEVTVNACLIGLPPFFSLVGGIVSMILGPLSEDTDDVRHGVSHRGSICVASQACGDAVASIELKRIAHRL